MLVSNGLSEEETVNVASAIATNDSFLSDIDFVNKSATRNVEILNNKIKNPDLFKSLETARDNKNMEQNLQFYRKSGIDKVEDHLGREYANEKSIQIKVISSREKISTLKPNENFVHLNFRPSKKDIHLLAKTVPKIKAIQFHNRSLNQISELKQFLETQRFQPMEIWNHETEINAYYTVLVPVFEKIMAMKIDRPTDDLI